MSKEFVVNLPQEQINYIQRLNNEVNDKIFVLDRLFVKHMDDTDLQLFDLKPFKYYMENYELAFLQYSLATEQLDIYLKELARDMTGDECCNVSWIIEDYGENECKVRII
jgi:hypothetical protein